MTRDHPGDSSGDDTSTGAGAARPRPSGADRARDELLADLDARLRRHEADTRAALEQLDASVAESAGLLSQALPRIDELRERVAELTGRLDTRPSNGPAGGGSGADGVAPVLWPALSAERAEREWNRLGQWVATVLGPWYQVTRGQVPDCWALHRPVQLTLSWLHCAHVAAHTGPAASAVAAAEWHTRWLPAALDAIAAAAPTAVQSGRPGSGPWDGLICHPGFHLDTRPRNERAAREENHRPAQQHEMPDGQQGSWQPTIEITSDPIEYRFWGRFWQQAVTDDVRARRQRESEGGPADAG